MSLFTRAAQVRDGPDEANAVLSDYIDKFYNLPLYGGGQRGPSMRVNAMEARTVIPRPLLKTLMV